MKDAETYISGIVLLLLVASPFAYYYYCYKKSRRRLPQEHNRKPVYETSCTLRLDGKIHRMARIALYEDFLVIVSVNNDYFIALDQIRSVLPVKLPFFHCRYFLKI